MSNREYCKDYTEKKHNGFTSTEDIYFQEINKRSGLPAQEEANLAIRIQKGDKKALDKLVVYNLPFVASVAINYQNQGMPLGDLIGEGNLGLIKAAKRFDEKRKFKFISYAVWWIRQAILKGLAENSRILKLPLHRANEIYNINKTEDKLKQKYHYTPDVEEIIKELDGKVERAHVFDDIQLRKSHKSLDQKVGDDSDDVFKNVILQGTVDPPDEGIELDSFRKEIYNIMANKLTQRETKIMRLYYGVGEDVSYTLQEIGDMFDLTRERVRQLKDKAIRILRTSPKIARLLKQTFDY